MSTVLYYFCCLLLCSEKIRFSDQGLHSTLSCVLQRGALRAPREETLHSTLSCVLQPPEAQYRLYTILLHSTLSCGLQLQIGVHIAFTPRSRAGCSLCDCAPDKARGPSLRTLMRVATADMHKMFGARTDYYVRLNLIECEGRPGGPGSYSHYLDFGTGSRPQLRKSVFCVSASGIFGGPGAILLFCQARECLLPIRAHSIVDVLCVLFSILNGRLEYFFVCFLQSAGQCLKDVNEDIFCLLPKLSLVTPR